MEQSDELKRGWKVVLAASLGVGTGLSPIPFYTIGVFVRPLSAEFGWTVEQILATLAVLTVSVLVASPAIGLLTDRIGVRKMALGSTAAFGLCLMLFALNPGSLALFYANYALLAVVGAGTLPITWTKAVNTWFSRQRGLALGLSLMSTGIFGSLAKLAANWMVDHAGWRMAYVGLAGFPLLISLPVALLFFHEKAAPAAKAKIQIVGATLGQALVTRQFWTMSIALAMVTLGIGGIIPNLERLLGSKGFDPTTAVQLASVIGVAVTIGRPVGGWLVDRFWAPAIAFVILAAPALSFFALSHGAPSPLITAGCVFLIGFASGVEYDIVAYLVVRYYGMRAYSAIYGCLYMAFALGAGLGPALIGRAYMADKSYDGVLVAIAGVVLVGAGLFLTLGRYPARDQNRAEIDAETGELSIIA